MNKIKHSEYIDTFLQYLWSDLLENQDLSKELIDVLNEAGSKLKEAKTLLIEKEPEHDGNVIHIEYVLDNKDISDLADARDLVLQTESMLKAKREILLKNIELVDVAQVKISDILFKLTGDTFYLSREKIS